MTDTLAYGDGLGASVIILAALVAVAGVIWLAGWIRGERQRRRDRTAVKLHGQYLTVLLALAVNQGDDEAETEFTRQLEDYGYTVTRDEKTIRVTGPRS
mgnify:FL=1